MLSYKVTYGIQILDLLQQSKRGMSLSEIRAHFIFLPSRIFISDITKQFESHRLISKISSHSNRYKLMFSVDEITLCALSKVVDGELVFGTPVGFNYWHLGYCNAHPQIEEYEKQLGKEVSELLKSTTVGDLLAKKEKQKRQKIKKAGANPADE